MLIKPLPQSIDAETGFAHTGPPLHLPDHHDNQDEAGHWMLHTIIEPENEADVICEDEAPSMDVYVASTELKHKEEDEWKCPSPC